MKESIEIIKRFLENKYSLRPHEEFYKSKEHLKEPWMKLTGLAHPETTNPDKPRPFILVKHPAMIMQLQGKGQSIFPTRAGYDFSLAILELNTSIGTATDLLTKNVSDLPITNIYLHNHPDGSKDDITHVKIPSNFAEDPRFAKLRIETFKKESSSNTPRKMP